VTKDTLDMRMWQIQETKLKMINQLRTRQIERDIDNAFEDMEMSAGEMQAAATGNMDLLREIQAAHRHEEARAALRKQAGAASTRRRRTERTSRRAPSCRKPGATPRATDRPSCGSTKAPPTRGARC
jgi:hypothetical protein